MCTIKIRMFWEFSAEIQSENLQYPCTMHDKIKLTPMLNTSELSWVNANLIFI